MATPKDVIWELEAHTRAKHEILKRYLEAWMVILSQGGFPDILYIDGFAGPGEYKGGDLGSPIIALDIALAYGRPLQAQVHFLFVEKDTERADHLKRQVASRTLPSNFHVIVDGGVTFEDAFAKRYPQCIRNGRLMPTFAFIDPFGWKGNPFALIKRILANPSCEVFVNFMYEEINRFLTLPEQTENFTTLFGTDEWKKCLDLAQPRRRNRCLHDLYVRQLHNEAGAEHVRSFEMSNDRDVTDYYLFYATNNKLGLQKMKAAMWKVDETGGFHFSDSTDPNQLILLGKEANSGVLRAQLIRQFTGKSPTREEIEDFVVVETAFRETHYKAILKALETENKIEILDARLGRRKRTFGDSTMRIKFLP